MKSQADAPEATIWLLTVHMLIYCVSANGVNLFKQIIDIYLIRAGETHMTSEWTVDK